MNVQPGDINTGDIVLVKTWDREAKAWGEPIRWTVDEVRYAHEWQGPMFVGTAMEGPLEGKTMCEMYDKILAIVTPEQPADDDLVYARCLACGYESHDATTLELWNGYGDHGGPTWAPTCSDHSLWVRRDGSVVIVNGDHPDFTTEIDAPEDCCSSCGEIKKIAHMTSHYRHGIDPCGVMYCRECEANPATIEGA